jgi:hypothetical protein
LCRVQITKDHVILEFERGTKPALAYFHERVTLQLHLSKAWIAFILIATAVPAGFRNPFVNYLPHWHSMWEVNDAINNLLLFVPLGAFLRPGRSLSQVGRFGAGLSGMIELAQLFFLRRNSQPSDFIFNTLGALCGGIAAKHFGLRSDIVPLRKSSAVAAVLAAAVWSAVYLSVAPTIRPFWGRGTIGISAFLCAVGIIGIVRPASRYSRIILGLAGGAVTAGILLRAPQLEVATTLLPGLIFGCAGALGTTSGDDRRRQSNRPPAPAGAADQRSA